MKVLNIIAFAAAIMAATLVTSCSVNDEIHEPQRAVAFTSSITQQAQVDSRAAGVDWASGDRIGIFMVDGSGNVVGEMGNKQYLAATGGSLTAAPDNEIYYPQDGSTVNFTAYYPYADGSTFGTPYQVRIGNQDAQEGFDLLWAKTTAGYNKATTEAVKLTFEHKLAKIVMDCKAEDNVGISSFDGVTVTIGGMNTVNTFDLSAGTLGTADTPADITPRKLASAATAFMASYDAIIMPGSYGDGDVKVVFMVGSEPFTWDVGAVEFQAGNQYNYHVTLTRNGVDVTGTIKPWEGIDRGQVTAE